MATDEISRKRRRKPGDIAALRRTLWAALLEIEGLLDDVDPTTKIKAGHCLGTLAGSYLKCIEMTDVIGRIEALEAAAEASNVTQMRRAS